MVALDLKAQSATVSLEAAEYLITVACVGDASPEQWQDWINTIKAKDEIWRELTTKSGKIQSVNLRDRLFELELVETSTDSL